MKKLVLTSFLILMSCYSFRGSLPSNLKMIHIENVKNKETRERNYSPEFTELIVNAFIDDNTLISVGKKNADLILVCTIQSIDQRVESFSVQNNQAQSDLLKLTMRINIQCKNSKTDKFLVKKSLSHDVSIGAQDSESVRDEKIQAIMLELTAQIVDNVVGAW